MFDLRSLAVAPAVAGAVLVAAPSLAHADEPPPAPAIIVANEPVANQNHWYGWQTLAVDLGVELGGFAAVQAGGGTPSIASGSAVIAGYALGAPIVHALHGHWGKAGISLAMRATGWAVLGAAGYGIGTATGAKDADMYGALIGMGIGILAPKVIDAAVLANEKVPTKPQERSIMPTASVVPNGGGMVGAVGTF